MTTPTVNDLLATGQTLLQEVALRYAADHGLRPDTVAWEEQFDGWRLKVADAEHSIQMVFSCDEIEDFAAGGEGSRSSKVKIRNAFAQLTM